MHIEKEKKAIDKQSGFNLMELLFALVIIGGMVIGIVAMYNKNQNTVNSKTIAQDIQTISTGVKSSYSADVTGFTDVNNLNVVKLGLVPKTLSVNATSGDIKNKYSGVVNVEPGEKNGDTTSSFTISEASLPSEVINKVLTQLGTEGMVAIGVGKTAASTVCLFSSGADGQAGGTSAKTGCSASLAFKTDTLAAQLKDIGDNGTLVIVYGQ